MGTPATSAERRCGDHSISPMTPETSQTPAGVGAVAQVFVDDLDGIVVSPDDEHHLGSVLRLRPGEIVVASDGAGRWRPCRFRGAGVRGAPNLRCSSPTGPS